MAVHLLSTHFQHLYQSFLLMSPPVIPHCFPFQMGSLISGLCSHFPRCIHEYIQSVDLLRFPLHHFRTQYRLRWSADNIPMYVHARSSLSAYNSLAYVHAPDFASALAAVPVSARIQPLFQPVLPPLPAPIITLGAYSYTIIFHKFVLSLFSFCAVLPFR